jgi:hypothetical protein
MHSLRWRKSLKSKKKNFKSKLRKLKHKLMSLQLSKKSFKLSLKPNKLRFKPKEKPIWLSYRKHKAMMICKLSRFNRCNKRWKNKGWKWLKKKLS